MMDIVDFRAAEPIVQKLRDVETALLEARDVADEASTDAGCLCISKHDDGSGWNVNLSGVMDAGVFMAHIIECLEDKRAETLQELTSIN